MARRCHSMSGCARCGATSETAPEWCSPSSIMGVSSARFRWERSVMAPCALVWSAIGSTSVAQVVDMLLWLSRCWLIGRCSTLPDRNCIVWRLTCFLKMSVPARSRSRWEHVMRVCANRICSSTGNGVIMNRTRCCRSAHQTVSPHG